MDNLSSHSSGKNYKLINFHKLFTIFFKNIEIDLSDFTKIKLKN